MTCVFALWKFERPRKLKGLSQGVVMRAWWLHLGARGRKRVVVPFLMAY